MLIHTCDLYVPVKPNEVSIVWSSLINKEFMNQNKQERELGLPETPFYKNLDNLKVVAKSESFFIARIVEPLWVQVDRFLEGCLTKQRTNLKINEEYWRNILAKEEENEPNPE